MIKLVDLLVEIGDSAAGAFGNVSLQDVQYTEDGKPLKSTYSFSSDQNDYVVNVKYMPDPKSPERYYLYVDFKTEGGRFSDVTKENVPLRIMATVTEVMKKEAERVKSDKKIATKDRENIVAGMIFSPAKSYSLDKVGRAVETGSSKRKGLYAAYIKRNVPGAKEAQVPAGLDFPSDVSVDNLIAFEFPLKKTSFLGKVGSGIKSIFK